MSWMQVEPQKLQMMIWMEANSAFAKENPFEYCLVHADFDWARRLNLDEKEIVEALKVGDEGAFRHLIANYSARLMRKAEQMLGCREDAHECVQECFLQVYRKISDFRGEAGLYTWMHRILVNNCLMKIRKRKRQNMVSIDTLMPEFDENNCRIEPLWQELLSAEELLSRRETRSAVQSGISSLPDDYRLILILRDIEGYTTAEAAQVLSISESAAKVRLHRSRSALKKILEPMLRGEEV